MMETYFAADKTSRASWYMYVILAFIAIMILYFQRDSINLLQRWWQYGLGGLMLITGWAYRSRFRIRFICVVDDMHVYVHYLAKRYMREPDTYTMIEDKGKKFIYYFERANVKRAYAVTAADEKERLTLPMEGTRQVEVIERSLVKNIDRAVCLEFKAPLKMYYEGLRIPFVDKKVTYPEISRIYVSVAEPEKLVEYFSKR